jgi:DNA-binding beta-propeller fold protein YncE
LPGVEQSGAIRLHNQWSLRPAGRQVEVGDFPITLALHPNGKYLVVLHAGMGDHEIWVLDVQENRNKPVCRVQLEQTFGGLAFTPDGKRLLAGGGEFDRLHRFDFADGYLSGQQTIALARPKCIPASLAVDPSGDWVYAAATWGHAVAILPLKEPATQIFIDLEKGSYPYGCLIDAAGKRLYVSLWSKSAVAVIDLEQKKLVHTWTTQAHPTEMALGPKDQTLFVACANSTQVSVLRTSDGQPLETLSCALYPKAPTGNTPDSLCLTPDGQLLFVANADANNVAVFNVAKPGNSLPLGFIPVGMYPASVRVSPIDKRIYVANGRGTTPHANTQGPNPLLTEKATIREFIGKLYRGTVSVIEMPTEERMILYNRHARLCSPLREDLAPIAAAPEGNPIPAKVGGASPIKYCLYVIRENRTYDQVLGDMKEGNGDPGLCLFPEKVTPNAHRISREFVLLDNFYCEGEVSAEGHEWTMGAYCSDFVKRVWPLSYRGSPTKQLKIYPAEGRFDEVARPAGGYLWDRCAAAKVSYRSYGEWIENGKTPKDPGTARVKALEGHFDSWYRGFDMEYPDAKRADRFLEELRRFEKEGDMPRLQIVRLPNDHTVGTKLGKPTPTAMVAENDFALGRLIEAVSKSRFWKETAIFVVEDDAQNGSDHVDAHRTVALVISPYTKRAHVDSTMYSTSSMLRTMELILGLEPMSQFDAAARPMYASFQKEPNLTPYAAIVPSVDMNAVNTKAAWGWKLSDTFDFTKEDEVDDLIFNEVIWRSVRGGDAPMPAPVRASFFFPHLSARN